MFLFNEFNGCPSPAASTQRSLARDLCVAHWSSDNPIEPDIRAPQPPACDPPEASADTARGEPGQPQPAAATDRSPSPSRTMSRTNGSGTVCREAATPEVEALRDGNGPPAAMDVRSYDFVGVVRIHVPCVRCGYDLHGSPAPGPCAECGHPIEETLRFVIDPASSAVRPLAHPERLGRVLVSLAAGAIVLAAMFWIPQGLAFIDRATSANRTPLLLEWPRWVLVLGAALLLAGAAGIATTFRRPIGTALPPACYVRGVRRAVVGLAIAATAVGGLALYDWMFPERWVGHFDPDTLDPPRNTLRLLFALGSVVAIVGFRPILRLLAIRSLHHRVGAVGQQGLIAIMLAVGVAALGDLTRLVVGLLSSTDQEAARWLGVMAASGMLLLVGNAMLTLGLLNFLGDMIRLDRGLQRRTYQPEEVLDPLG